MNENINQIMFHVFQKDQAGTKVFEYLKSRFYDRSVFKADPYTTAYNAGQHDLILNIIRMMESTQEQHKGN